jgi:hypothetical protein
VVLTDALEEVPLAHLDRVWRRKSSSRLPGSQYSLVVLNVDVDKQPLPLHTSSNNYFKDMSCLPLTETVAPQGFPRF